MRFVFCKIEGDRKRGVVALDFPYLCKKMHIDD
jgi:hypothetical protein